MEVYTIGFTKKSAETFFGILKRVGIRRLIDIRLNNKSQLAGFTKQDDLRYFLKELCGAEYIHEPMLAPTDEILNSYKKKKIGWEEYEKRFLDLLAERKVEEKINRVLFDIPTVLLCSEATPEQCHRRLTAEYFARRWNGLEILHL
jgi:uncharacterized protein (DUF488 family)